MGPCDAAAEDGEKWMGLTLVDRGTYATVYRCSTTPPMVVKSQKATMHAREMAILRHLHRRRDSCGLADYLPALYASSSDCIVMESCPSNLFDARVANALRDPRDVATQCVGAVAYLHSMRVVHRDIKLENFVLTAAQRVKVIDFGFSHILPASEVAPTQAQGVCGSISYLAPECFHTPASVPCLYSVDVWALGVVVFAVLVGRLLLDEATLRGMKKTREEVLRLMDHADVVARVVSADMRDAVGRLLQPSTPRCGAGDVFFRLRHGAQRDASLAEPRVEMPRVSTTTACRCA